LARRGVAALVAAVVIGGCGLSEGPADVEGPVTVHVSLPSSPDGRDAADGARLALEEAEGKAGDLDVRARFLDDPSGSTVDLAAVGANARGAAQDSSTAAYIGELSSGSTRTSAPILNDAGIAQVSPGATAVDLTGPAPGFEDAPDLYRPSGNVTFTRVIPSEAIVKRALERVQEGTVVAPLAPESLPPPGQEFLDRFRAEYGRDAGPYAAYGYEAMAVILDAIEQRDTGAGNLRSSVVDSLLKVERLDESVIGPYSFTTEGDTTLCEVQVYSPELEPLRTICPSG